MYAGGGQPQPQQTGRESGSGGEDSSETVQRLLRAAISTLQSLLPDDIVPPALLYGASPPSAPRRQQHAPSVGDSHNHSHGVTAGSPVGPLVAAAAAAATTVSGHQLPTAVNDDPTVSATPPSYRHPSHPYPHHRAAAQHLPRSGRGVAGWDDEVKCSSSSSSGDSGSGSGTQVTWQFSSAGGADSAASTTRMMSVAPILIAGEGAAQCREEARALRSGATIAAYMGGDDEASASPLLFARSPTSVIITLLPRVVAVTTERLATHRGPALLRISVAGGFGVAEGGGGGGGSSALDPDCAVAIDVDATLLPAVQLLQRLPAAVPGVAAVSFTELKAAVVAAAAACSEGERGRGQAGEAAVVQGASSQKEAGGTDALVYAQAGSLLVRLLAVLRYFGVLRVVAAE